MRPYYQADGITLFHGDALDCAEEWLEADILITDPPYGISYKGKWQRSAGKVDIAGDATTNLRDEVLALWGDIRPGLVFGSWRARNIPANTQAVIIWDKTDGIGVGMGHLPCPWGSSHEEVYAIGRWRRDPNIDRVGSVIRTNLHVTGTATQIGHPTPKPVGLLERLIGSCMPGTIADPFAGSGSTLIAARNQGREAIGVEIEEKYCELIVARLAQTPLPY
jgi:DNA modification methylase